MSDKKLLNFSVGKSGHAPAAPVLMPTNPKECQNTAQPKVPPQKIKIETSPPPLEG